MAGTQMRALSSPLRSSRSVSGPLMSVPISAAITIKREPR